MNLTFHEAELIVITALIISAPFVTGEITEILPIDTARSWAVTAEPWATDTAYAGAQGQDRAYPVRDAP